MKKSEHRRQINSRWIGYDPDTMKTAHIANGLFLQLLETQFPTENVNRLAVQYGRKGPVKAHLTDKLIEEIPSLDGKDRDQVDQFRQHLREHLGADSAIFDRQLTVGNAYSAATARLITDDRHNDGWSGNFIGLLLRHDFGDGPSRIVEKVRTALADETDPLSVVVSPFLEEEAEAEKFETDLGYADKAPVTFVGLYDLPEMLWIRESIDCFSQYYPQYLSKERFIRLLVILSSFGLLRHILALSQVSGPRMPFLMDSLQETTTRMRLASRTNYIRCMVSVEEFYIGIMKEYIVEFIEHSYGTAPDEQAIVDGCIEFLKHIDDLSEESAELVLQEISAQDVNDYLDQFTRNLVKQFAKNAFYTDFFRSVGLRCGVLMPRGPYQNKHFAFQPDTLEALLLGCVDIDEMITMGDFAERLWNRYGIVIGGLPQDIEILNNVAIQEVNQDDLTLNYNTFTQRMVDLGLAKKHSDGLVLVRPYWK